jgi:hypothetical protein
MKPKRLTIIATILIVFTVGNGYGSAESLSTQALSQIKEFIQFYREDPKVLSTYRIIEDLCREEDGQTDTILEMFQATRMENPNGALQIEAIQENFLKLTTNDLDYIQDIFLYQIKTGKRFDLNFFHNLSVRSALNAIRLQYRDPGNIPEYIHLLKRNIEKLRRDIISSDQKLVSAAKLEANKKNYSKLISKVNNDYQSALVSLDDPGIFSSFYEVALTFYSTEFIKSFNFFDHYEFMQYLLFFADQNREPNGFYSKGPFNLSNLTADLTKPDKTKPISLLTIGFFAPPQKRPDLVFRGTPLSYLASIAYSKFDPAKLPEEVKTLYNHLTRKYNPKSRKYDDRVSDQIFRNRIYVLADMNEQDFYQRYRNIKNGDLFFDYARKKLTLSKLKSILQQEYTLPGGVITMPRYELMGYTKAEFMAEQETTEILKRIPDIVHIEFIRPLILEIFGQLTEDEMKKISSERVQEIAEHFGSPPGRTGDKALYTEFFDIFGQDIWNGAVELSKQVDIGELDAFKWIAILLTIESRGNMFAVSSTGALGPLQHTYYFYFKLQPASIPFDPKKSAVKTGQEFGKYYKQYKSIEKAVVCYHDGTGVMQKANTKENWREQISPAADKYIQRFTQYLTALDGAKDYRDVVLKLKAVAF